MIFVSVIPADTSRVPVYFILWQSRFPVSVVHVPEVGCGKMGVLIESLIWSGHTPDRICDSIRTPIQVTEETIC